MAPAQQTFPLPATSPAQHNGATRPVDVAPMPAVAPAAPESALAAPEPPATRADEQAKAAGPAPRKAPTRKAPARKKPPAKKATATPRAKQAPKAPVRAKGWARLQVGEDQVFNAAGYAVAATAVVVSYSHMYEVAHLAGQDWRSFLLPVSVDALALGSSMAVRRCRRLGLAPGLLVWVSLVVSVAASLAANLAAANPDMVDPSVLRWAVGAWPPMAFLLAELVIQRWHRAAKEATTPTPAPTGRRRPGALEPLDTRPAPAAP